MIASLIQAQDKSPHDLECILELYHILHPRVRKTLAPLIVAEYHRITDILSKCTLAPEILAIQGLTFEAVFGHIRNCSAS
jgi:hypothetical protein